MLVPAITGLFGVLLGTRGNIDSALHTYLDCAAKTLLRMKLHSKIQYRDWCFTGESQGSLFDIAVCMCYTQLRFTNYMRYS